MSRSTHNDEALESDSIAAGGPRSDSASGCRPRARSRRFGVGGGPRPRSHGRARPAVRPPDCGARARRPRARRRSSAPRRPRALPLSAARRAPRGGRGSSCGSRAGRSRDSSPAPCRARPGPRGTARRAPPGTTRASARARARRAGGGVVLEQLLDRGAGVPARDHPHVPAARVGRLGDQHELDGERLGDAAHGPAQERLADFAGGGRRAGGARRRGGVVSRRSPPRPVVPQLRS